MIKFWTLKQESPNDILIKKRILVHKLCNKIFSKSIVENILAFIPNKNIPKNYIYNRYIKAKFK
jgi:hypothetical protein